MMKGTVLPEPKTEKNYRVVLCTWNVTKENSLYRVTKVLTDILSHSRGYERRDHNHKGFIILIQDESSHELIGDW